MCRRKIPIVVFLIIVGLLLGTSVPTMGAGIESIQYSDVELSKHPGNTFQLISGVGVHLFDLDKGQDFDSMGYIALSNTFDNAISVSLEIVLPLSTVDLDSEGNPRIHPTISNAIYFRKYSKSWIELEYTEVTIEANSWCRVPYTIHIPYEQAWKSIDNNITNGFLGYVNIKKAEKQQSGMSIGINYNYKIFSIFQGEYNVRMNIFFFVTVGIIMVTIVGYSIDKVLKRKKQKRWQG